MKKMIICLIVFLGFSFSQTHNTICRIKEFADTTGWYWRMWHIDGSGNIIPQHTVDKHTTLTSEGWNAGPPPYAFWMYNLANWPPPSWSAGDRLLVQTDWDSAYGDLVHTGFYAILNDTVRGDSNPQFTPDDTLRAIPNPRPTVWDSVHGDTLFISVDTISLVWDLPRQTTGIPDTNNIIGYGVYRDTSGTGEDDTLSDGSYQYFEFTKFVSDTFCQDTLPAGYDGHVYYCIKLVYRPDTTGAESEPGFSTRFLSQNSILIYNTAIVGIEEETNTCSKSEILEISPNPFIDKIAIKYSTEQRAKGTELKIYDVTGKLVKSFLLPSSNFLLPTSISWDCLDRTGSKVPSGVYVVRLEAAGHAIIEKIVKVE
jgi:hypothetical protein